MRTPSHDPLVAATARLLRADPTLTNLEILRKLASSLGEQMVQRVPANRFQRQVRDPAMRLLRNGRMNGEHASPPGLPASEAAEGARARPGSVPPTGSGSVPSSAILYEALLEAFVLGSSWEGRREAVTALRRLLALHERIGRGLERKGEREGSAPTLDGSLAARPADGVS